MHINNSEPLNLISWNVNGIRSLEKKGFADIVRALGPDLLAIQETKASPDQLSDDLKEIPGYLSFWNSAVRKGYSGVAIYARHEPQSVSYGLGIAEHDQEGRVLTLEYDDFFFVNVYFPNAQPELARIDYKISFNTAVQHFTDRLALKKNVVVCGDFNVAHKPIDLKNPKQNEENAGYSAKERAWMDGFINAGYIDTFRKFNQEPGQYTWWSYRFNARSKNIGWRIDYFCVDAASDSRLVAANILKDIPGSDHCPVQLLFL